MNNLATLNIGTTSESCTLRVAGRELIPLLPITAIDVVVRPGKFTVINLEVRAAVVNVLGVPVLQVRKGDGSLVTGRLILDDGTSYP